MLRKTRTLMAISAATIWVASAGAKADAKSVLANASKALGADGLKTLEFTGSGYDFVIGQNASPSAAWPRFNDKTYTRVVSFDDWATRMQRVRTQAENPPHGGGQQPIIGDQTKCKRRKVLRPAMS